MTSMIADESGAPVDEDRLASNGDAVDDLAEAVGETDLRQRRRRDAFGHAASVQ